MILNSPYITGSLTVTGDATIAGNITVTGSLSGTAATASFALTLGGTGSVGFATTGAFSATSGSASSRLTQIEQVYATTGSNSFRATQSITGSLTVTGQIIAQTLNVQQVTSSIVFSSGSNTFGCDLNSRQTFTGSMFVTGSSFNANVNTACFSNAVCNLVSIITGCASIGSTSAPSSTLDITRSSPDPFNTVQCQISLINGGGNSGAGSQLNFNIGGAIPHIRGLVDGVNSNAGAALVFATACFNGVGIERMRISNTGCIGIGAISPQATVHICTVNTTANLRVESACDQAGLRLIAGVSGVARATRIDFLNGATCVGRPQWSIINDYNQNGTNDLRFINCDPATSLFSITQSGIACFACRVCAPTFLASTNIGINDASPSAKLQINCTNTWGDQINESINIVNSGANGNINIQHNMGAFTWYSGAVKTAAITAWRNTPSSGNFVDLAFATATAGTQVERMRIMSNGAVGISCATPTYTLDVSGTVRIGNGGRLYINQLLPLGIVFRNDEFPDGDANNTQVSDTAATNGNAKRRLSSAPSTTFFYGPYTTIPAGTYIAYFRLKVANNSSSSNIVYIDITNAVIPGGGVNIAPNAFAASNRYQYFKIPFIVTDPTAIMEFRGLSFVSGITDLFLDHVMILPGS